MANTVNLPLVGPTNKTTAFLAVGGGITVGAYMLYRNQKKKAAAAAAAATKTGPGYGYGYGYGANTMYGYGSSMYGEFQPYPTGDAYGYGAYGYGYYNPYTGQYLGGGPGGSPGEPGGGAPTTNAQWEQDAIQILQGEGYNALSVQQVLGIYLAGGPYTNWNAQDQTILNAAIGAAGEPPQPPTQEPPGVGTGTPQPPIGTGNPPPGGSMVTVPNVVGNRYQTANLKLKRVGLKSQIGPGFNRNEVNKVGSQTPGAGQQRAKGDTVDLGDWQH